MGAIRTAQSCATDVQTAVAELHQGLDQPDLSLVVFFCSPAYDQEALARAINSRFPGIRVVGCSALGSYGAYGYQRHALTGVSFSRSSFVAEVGVFDALQGFDAQAAQHQVLEMRQSLEAQAPWVESINTFALQLIDGLSVKEETVTRTMQNALGAIFMVGGSAADSLEFRQTWVFANGAFRSDRSVLVLVATRVPFYLFMTEHFKPREERLVVTRADASQRIVYEINALPAASEYARCAGVPLERLGADLFSRMPVVVKFGDSHYVRSIQRLLPGGALQFYCAIAEGMVLRLSDGESLIDDLKDLFASIEERLGEPQLVLGCDCALRRVEIEQNGLSPEVDQLCIRHQVLGFSTFGEQYRGVHLNQTLSGIAFGQPAGADDDDRR